MADDDKHPVRNLIVFPVLVALIVAALLYFIPKFFAFTVNAISIAWQYLVAKTLLPNSVLFLLLILAIPTLVNLVNYFIRSKVQKASDEPSIKSYTTDKVFGMVWKWSFITDKDMPSQDL